jgi:lysophospholipase L1-like esterase
MAPIWRFIWLVVCIASLAICVPVILSGTLRATYVSAVDRKIASIWPPEYAFVGDSLTANCNWRWELGTFSIINLAVGGTSIRDIAHQLIQALALKAEFVFIEGGINDVILDSAPVDRIASDFGTLLGEIPLHQKAVVTLIPFVSYHLLSDRIEAANSAIKSLVETRRLPIVDLNPKLASEGVRKGEMTTDGIHFTEKACAIWADEIRAEVDALKSSGSPL